MTRDVAKAFFEADIDDSRALSFEEFLTVVPAQMKSGKSQNALRSMFEVVDTDGSGAVTMDEFFIWTLSCMKTTKGTGLEEVFQRYDADHIGTLNVSEFARAAEDIGYGDIANDIFMEFNPDNSGTVSHAEILQMIKSHSVSRDAKRFLTEITFDATRQAIQLNPSEWDLNSDSKESIRAQLAYLMREHDPPARVQDLFNFMAKGREVLRREDFDEAMLRIGLPAKSIWLVDALFKQIDLDGSGDVTIREMSAWLNGVEIRKGLARKLRLRSRDGLVLRDLTWNAATLRAQLQVALIDAGLSPIDLLRAWDTRADGTGAFSKREMLIMMKQITGDLELWDDHVRDAVVEAFTVLAGSDKSLDVEELQKFLQDGWSEVKKQLGKGERRVRTAPTLGKSRSEPIFFGDPRWPNRVWPARRGHSAYARRLVYRPSPLLQAPPQAPPTQAASRHTSSSFHSRHYSLTPEAKAVRELIASRPEYNARVLTHHYFQAHVPARRHAVGRGPSYPSLPSTGTSRTCVVVSRPRCI